MLSSCYSDSAVNSARRARRARRSEPCLDFSDGLEWSLVMMDLDSSASLSCQRGWSAIKSVCVLIKLRREKEKIIRRLAQDEQARRRVRAWLLF